MKPRLPVTIPLLGFVTTAGLVALFLAAHYAFSQVTVSPVHAIAAAALIETAIVFEAITFTRTRNRIALAGLILSFTVSMLYNYVQASLRAETLHPLWWVHEAVLLALAIGPLSALAFVGLALGNELRGYAEAVQAWETNRQAKKDEAEEWARAVEDRTLAGELELQAEAMRLKHELALEEIRVEERTRKRAEKRAAAPASSPEPNGNLTGTLPEWIAEQPQDRADFRRLVDEGRIVLPPERPTGNEMVQWFDAVRTDRVGRLWTGDFYEKETNGLQPATGGHS